MKKKMNAKVFSRNNEYGKMDFYLEVDREFFYLFTTDYFSKNIYEQYRAGRRLEDAYNKTSMIRHQKLKERIIRMSKYTAQENKFKLFKKRHRPAYKKDKYNDFDYEVA